MTHDRAGPGVVRSAFLKLASAAPKRIAYASAEDPAVTLTRGDLLRQAAGIASAVVERTRSPHAPVIVALENGPALAAAFAAAMLGDFPIALLSVATPDAELASTARRLGSDMLISRRCIDGLRTLDPGDIAPTGEVERLMSGAGRGRWAVILSTSGTTAQPKLVLREAAALDAVAVNTVRCLRLTENDRILAAIPMAHSYGLEHTLLAPILSGAGVVTMRAFDAARAALLLGSSTTVFPGVPVMFDALGLPAHAPVSTAARPRLVYSAGAPLPATTRSRFEERWNIEIGNLYGSTDVGSVVFNDPASPGFDPEFAGLPMPGVSVRILQSHAPDGLPVSAGEIGHVAICAPSMLTSYVDGPEPVMADGHLLTGDLGQFDGQRGLRLTGREALLLDIDGRKVNPAEVEEALCGHPGVAAAMVVPLAVTPTIGRLRAVIEPRDRAAPPSVAELRTALRATLPPYKIPRLFEFVDRLPRSESGKVLRGDRSIVRGDAASSHS